MDSSTEEKMCCEFRNGKKPPFFDVLAKKHDLICMCRVVVSELLADAAMNKHFTCFEWIDKHGRDVVLNDFACCSSLVEIPSISRNFLGSPEAKDILITMRKCAIFLEYAEMVGAVLVDDIWEAAANAGELGVLKFASSRVGFENFSQDILKAAAEGGCLNVLKLATNFKSQTFSPDIWVSAAEFGHVNILQYAHSRGVQFDEETWCKAVENGHLGIIRFAHKKGIDVGEKVWSIAAQKHFLGFLRWGHNNHMKLGQSVWNSASDAGFLKIVKFGLDEGYLDSLENKVLVLRSAVKNENIQIIANVLSALEKSTNLDIVWSFAAKLGKESVIDFALKSGFPLNPDVWMTALKNQHFHLIQLAVKRRINIKEVWKEAKRTLAFGALFIGVKFSKTPLSREILMAAVKDHSLEGNNLVKLVIQTRKLYIPSEIWCFAHHDVLLEALEFNIEISDHIFRIMDIQSVVETHGYYLLCAALKNNISLPHHVFFLAAEDSRGFDFLTYVFAMGKVPEMVFEKAIDSGCGEEFLVFAFGRGHVDFDEDLWWKIAQKEGIRRHRLFKIAFEQKRMLPEDVWETLLTLNAFDILILAWQFGKFTRQRTIDKILLKATAWCRCGPCMQNNYRKLRHDSTKLLNVAFENYFIKKNIYLKLSLNGCSLISRALKKRTPFKVEVLASIAAGGDEAVMQLAFENGYNLNVPDIWTHVSLSDREENLKFPIVHQFKINEDVWILAAERGNFELLQLAFSHGFSFGHLTWLSAAKGVDGFKSLLMGIDAHVDFEKISEEVKGEEVKGGDRSVWLQAAITDTTAVVFKRALKKGYKFHDFGENVWQTAIREKNSAVICLAISNGFRLSDNELMKLVKCGKFEIVNFMLTKEIEVAEAVLLETSDRIMVDVVFTKEQGWKYHDFRRALRKRVACMRSRCKESAGGKKKSCNH